MAPWLWNFCRTGPDQIVLFSIECYQFSGLCGCTVRSVQLDERGWRLRTAVRRGTFMSSGGVTLEEVLREAVSFFRLDAFKI